MSDVSAPRPGRMQRAWRWLRWLLICYLLILLAMMLFEEKLIYFPSKFPEGDWNPRGLAVEDAEFSAEDGTQLHGWYLPHTAARAVLLVAHGNAGNITHRQDLLSTLHQFGAGFGG